MREIKFRAWDKKYKKYITVFTIDANGYFMSQSWSNDNKDIRTRHILEQYTGLKDMNGKEIFEGDIAIIDGIKCIIKWNKGCNGDLKYNGFYGFYGKDLGKIQGIDDHLTEVIGNIHENIELL